MNNRALLKRYEILLDESGFLDILIEGMQRDRRGRKTERNKFRNLFLGQLLGISELQTGLLSGAYESLTEGLDLRDAQRLGLADENQANGFLSVDRFYHAAKVLEERLNYGLGTIATLTPEERQRRHSVVLAAINALLDYTAEATEVDDYELAIDQTGVWAWLRGAFYHVPSEEEIEAQSDELIKEALRDLRATMLSKKKKGKKMQLSDDDLENAVVDPTLAKSKGDPDAAWSGKTSKNGGVQRFCGYYLSVMCAVPRAKKGDDPTTRAPIIRRLELTRSTDDVVPVTLRMIDSMKTRVKQVLVDRHYSFKNLERWGQPLTERGINQVLDLRSDEYQVLRMPEATLAGGCAFCPAMQTQALEEQRPNLFASHDEHKGYMIRRDELRKKAFRVKERISVTNSVKLSCPALGDNPTVACPFRPNSMLVAAERGLEIMNTDNLELEPGQERPRCCTQDSFRLTFPESAAKLYQNTPWGTSEWYEEYGGRSYVEGVFGNLKNPRTENLSRGSIQKSGMVWTELVIALMAAVYNIRVIRNRHERMENDPIDHPLLSDDEESTAHISLTKDQERMIVEAFLAGHDLENLLITPGALDDALGLSSTPAPAKPSAHRHRAPRKSRDAVKAGS